MQQDVEHLKMLKTGFYVYAGMTALFSLIPIVHIGMGVGMLSGAIPMGGPGGPPDWFPWMFIGIGVTVIVLGETMAVMNFLAGRRIAELRGRTFVIVIACINCLNMPLGTALGVLTLIVLGRPAVKDMFAGNPPAGWFQN